MVHQVWLTDLLAGRIVYIEQEVTIQYKPSKDHQLAHQEGTASNDSKWFTKTVYV